MTTKSHSTRSVRQTGDDLVAALMAEINNAKISRRLAEAREAAGLTQQQMADLLHVHKRSVEDYESVKKKTVPFDRIVEWAGATHTTTEWLLHGMEQISRSEVPDSDGLGQVLLRLEEIANAIANLERGQAALLRRLPAQKAVRQKPAAGSAKR